MTKDFFEQDPFDRRAENVVPAEPSSATGMFAAIPGDRPFSSDFAMSPAEETLKPPPSGMPPMGGGAEPLMPVVREIIIRSPASPSVDTGNADAPNAGEFTRILQTLRQPSSLPESHQEAHSFTELFRASSPVSGGARAVEPLPEAPANAGSFTQLLDGLGKASAPGLAPTQSVASQSSTRAPIQTRTGGIREEDATRMFAPSPLRHEVPRESDPQARPLMVSRDEVSRDREDVVVGTVRLPWFVPVLLIVDTLLLVLLLAAVLLRR